MVSSRSSHSLLVRLQNDTVNFGRQFGSNFFFFFVTKLNILLSHDPAISLLGIYPKEVKTYVCTKPCTIMLIAAFFFSIMA